MLYTLIIALFITIYLYVCIYAYMYVQLIYTTHYLIQSLYLYTLYTLYTYIIKYTHHVCMLFITTPQTTPPTFTKIHRVSYIISYVYTPQYTYIHILFVYALSVPSRRCPFFRPLSPENQRYNIHNCC